MNIKVIIPARLKSTRLPNKPLINILGKTLLQRTIEQTLKAVEHDSLYVATDSFEIVEHCNELGVNVILTSESCLTGTDRVAEVACKIDGDIFINVQGDEPLMDPDDITKVIALAKKHPDRIINGMAPIDSKNDFLSKSIPKVVTRSDGRLLYMSRAPIPGSKSGEFYLAYRQICVYAFPKDVLLKFASVKEKLLFESVEDIEILRFLELGFEVQMVLLSSNSIAVDHPEDVERVIAILKET
jgi:3-deoxy-manno-octulosonate cytidylyltransferase (CMP-KDO synthetase)